MSDSRQQAEQRLHRGMRNQRDSGGENGAQGTQTEGKPHPGAAALYCFIMSPAVPQAGCILQQGTLDGPGCEGPATRTPLPCSSTALRGGDQFVTSVTARVKGQMRPF